MPPMAFTGTVSRVGFMNKTATVIVTRWTVHPRTKKRMEKRTKLLIHDERNKLRIDDTVLVRNCPPISARKRFTLEKILKSPETERDEMHARMAAEAKRILGDGEDVFSSPLDSTLSHSEQSSSTTQPTAHAS